MNSLDLGANKDNAPYLSWLYHVILAIFEISPRAEIINNINHLD